MNEDTLTKEYKEKWEQVTLSDSSRQKMADNLRAYTSLHQVIEAPQPSPFFSYFKFAYTSAAALALIVLIGAASWRSENGDSLYALKMNIERLLGIEPYDSTYLAMETNVGQEQQESTLAPSEETDAPRPDNTLAMEAPPVASDSSLPDTTLEADSSARIAMTKESADVAEDDIVSTMMLTEGAMDIDLYRDDVAHRIKEYQTLLEEHDGELEAEVTAELTAKLDEASALYKEAEDKDEDAARLLLDTAMNRIGEVESSLSLLGEVTVEEGIIIDINLIGTSD